MMDGKSTLNSLILVKDHTWGGAKNTWRNDQLTSIDVAYMNHREIIALSGNNSNNNGNGNSTTV